MIRRTLTRATGSALIAALFLLAGAASVSRVHAEGQVQAPAKASQAQQSLIIYGDMVITGEGPTALADPSQSCTERNRYPQGDQVLFRIRVVDPVTQEPMDDTQIQSVTLTMPDGTTQNLDYGGLNRGQSRDHAWKYIWKIPEDYPTGTVNYQITAVDNQGRTGTYFRWDTPPSQLQIIPKGQS